MINANRELSLLFLPLTLLPEYYLNRRHVLLLINTPFKGKQVQIFQRLLLLLGQHCEGPPGVQMDPHAAALLREGPQARVLPQPGVLHGPQSDQHHDQPRHPGRL